MVARRLFAVVVAIALIPLAGVAGAGEVAAAGTVHGGIYPSAFWLYDDPGTPTPLDGELSLLKTATGTNVTFGGTFHSVNENSAAHNPASWSNTRTILDQVWLTEATPFANLTIPATAASIASGAWDAKITEWAGHVKGYLDLGGSRSVIIAPLQEMNGDWTPYGCDATNFKTAYIKIVNIFRGLGMDETQVRWAFAPNGWTSLGCGAMANYYPGHNYVDVIGASAYNFGAGCFANANSWDSPATILATALDEMRAIAPRKPFLVAQTGAPRSGCGANGGNGGQDQWVRDMFTYAAADPNVVGILYFNIDKSGAGEVDWRVWTGSATQGWTDGMTQSSTAYQWPLTSWFQPGQLTIDAAFGYLRVTTNPAVESQIVVNGVPYDTWGLTWVKVPPGNYTVSFRDLEGFTTPTQQAVTVTAGTTAAVTGTFTQRGLLRVSTNPAVPATISLDGVPRNDWGMWTDLAPGDYQVCFGDVADYTAPACETATVTAGNTTQVTGDYVADLGAAGPVGHGMLRVATSPAVPSQILVDGVPYDSWGLNWVKVAPGNYTVSFVDVAGYTTPAPQAVTVTEGATTAVTGTFAQQGQLRIVTSPAVPATVYVDDVPRNDWGMWTDLAPGNYQVCFGQVTGYAAPACEAVTVAAGATTQVTGIYSP